MTQNPKQESKKIIYFDVNNLYGYAMSKWIDPEDFDLNKYTSNMDVFLKFILNILKSYENYTMIIL